MKGPIEQPDLSDKAKDRLKRLQALGAKIETDGWTYPTIVLWDQENEESWTWIALYYLDHGFTDEEFEAYYQDFVTIANRNYTINNI